MSTRDDPGGRPRRAHAAADRRTAQAAARGARQAADRNGTWRRWRRGGFARSGRQHRLARASRSSTRFGDGVALRRCASRYSHEGRDFGGALETAGGIARALPLLGEAFWVVGGDVYRAGLRFTQAAVDRFAASGQLAHLCLVPNPQHNPKGDFGLRPDGLALNQADTEVHLFDHRPVPQGLVRRPARRQSTGPESPRWPHCCAMRWTMARSAPRSTPGLGPT